ncbi:mechanosensitive ion channel family protein [Brackiella oedipodis]|uniref:mechanosensitive ion channel family protein n=1 Tax=Brackiella oedipodis TaxID=124225 RepID=UPI000684905E|nr:mechanosensitive ion channel domain-containing protein [Brackiella oedipodis]
MDMQHVTAHDFSSRLVNFSITLAIAIVVLCVGWWLSKKAAQLLVKIAHRNQKIEPTVIPMLRDTAMWAVRIVTLLTAFGILGIQTTSIVAIIGAAGVAIGLALQGTLQNIAAGIMLLCLRPIRNGESVDIGSVSGTVEEINLFLTRLKKADGVYMTMPNSSIWNSTIVNYSRNKIRRMDLAVTVSYQDDITKVLEVLEEMIKKDPRILSEPTSYAFVSDYKDSVVVVNMRLWTNVEDFWATQEQIRAQIRQVLTQNGFALPVPLRAQVNDDDRDDDNQASVTADQDYPAAKPQTKAPQGQDQEAKPSASPEQTPDRAPHVVAANQASDKP